jgi:hypothetical protein
MTLPPNARDLFEEGNELENTRIIAAKIEHGNHLRLDLVDDTHGTFCVDIRVDQDEASTQFASFTVDYDEPLGAGADPYGRPDPQQHPEAWSE